MSNNPKLDDVAKQLSQVFERLIKKYGNTSDTRLMIARYTVGYVGVQYGPHIPE